LSRESPKSNAIQEALPLKEKQVADDKRYAHVRSRLQGIAKGTGQQVHDAMEKPNPYSVREVENVLDELVQKEPDKFEKAGEVYRWKKSYRFNVDEVVEQSLESSPKVVAVYPAYLRSNEKVEIEQRSNKFYWVLSEEEGGPFDNVEEAHEGFKRHGEERLKRERRGE